MRSPLELLDFNSTKTFIAPSAGQYPHLWLWDACFHAIFLAQLRPELAARELDALLAGQQADGMIPHVRFNPFVNPNQYRPNPKDWGTGGPVSGITQPPMVATALKLVFQRTGNRSLLRRAYPRVVRFHQWMKSIRDPENIGLAGIIHPWESGMDNSPSFDGLKDAFLRDHLSPGFQPPPRVDTTRVPSDQRPTDDYYLFYWGLIHQFQAMNWDQREMARRSPVFVADVLFNSIWAKANEDLASLAWLLGHTADERRFSEWSAQTRRALRHHCWHAYDRFFYSEDLRTQQLIPTKTIAGFMPLFAKAATPSIADALVEHLMDRQQFFFHLGVPSASFQSPQFDSRRYWRGSIWINMHWLLAEGLRDYDYFDIVFKIFAKSRQLVEKAGYWEYYNPLNGEGLGASHFSWSTLTETMKPLEPPAELHEPILVLSPEDAARHDELRTLYRHPWNGARKLTPQDITSVPPVYVSEVIQAIRQHPLTAISPISELQIPRRLRQVADIIHRLIQEKRDAWPEYPRICDLACLVGQEVFTGLGYRCQIRWTPDLHYFLLVKSRKGKLWIVDLSPSQFSWHPISRIPLLLERASLAIETALKKPSQAPLNLELMLRETQLAVQSNWVQLERNRMDRHERNAFLHGCRRHRGLIRRITSRVPLHQPLLHRYQRWLDGITQGASTRRE